jgi:ureidoacrylate peracid hydrolase
MDLARKVDPGHTALILVDLQKDFFCKGGIVDFMGDDAEAMQEILPRIQAFLSVARRYLGIIVFTRDTFSPHTCSPAAMEHFERAGMMAPYDPANEEFFGVVPAEGDIVMPKNKYSAFIGTALDAILRSNGIRTVVLAGVATNVCVESTARHAFMLDYSVVVPSDLVAGTDDEAKKMSLANLGRYFGEVVTSDQIVAAWESA